ncbi:lipoprotein-releasing ABC transporter ATP-binding protein LolD [Marinicella litoralis]|uniref:Lipoprotein-releasing system ATP-binding protein LolD n=1 Tax=Marinicella litoralis TaxID=644220 RepID=A0A4R6XIK3_9GAMM|nr:lipoprotein-releasing ABC transporter ATP-binding protein LolD [Marinicella litoralis]TDR19306.1 lipoprotein-releasing system ATP-binding protein [Marinicella litoralis]
MSDSVVLKCENLSKFFTDGQRKIQIFEGLDFQVKAGESVAIMGASGSGKSTLLHLLGGLDTANAGDINIQGQQLSKLSGRQRGLLRNQHLGFVYQFHHLLPEFSALENVMMPLLIGKTAKAAAKQQATEILQQVGLSDRLTHRPAQLSGGERQRAAIARAMVTSPACILADEPTGNLDEKTASSVMDLLINLKEQLNTSLVLVTHDQKVADKMQHQYLLQQGALIKLS